MDFKLLLAELKKDGLEVAEDAAILLVDKTLDWLVSEVVKTENKYDDLLVVIMPVIKPIIMAKLEEISKEPV